MINVPAKRPKSVTGPFQGMKEEVMDQFASKFGLDKPEFTKTRPVWGCPVYKFDRRLEFPSQKGINIDLLQRNVWAHVWAPTSVDRECSPVLLHQYIIVEPYIRYYNAIE